MARNPYGNAMELSTDIVFIRLFGEVCRKCFGHTVTSTLSETDSRQLANSIFESTGLVISVKTLRNYSQYVFHPTEEKRENPSVATLDTLARYLLDAPFTDELKRKKDEAHHPYWFRYKSMAAARIAEEGTLPQRKPLRPRDGRRIFLTILVGMILIVVITGLIYFPSGNSGNVVESFNNVSDDSLEEKGWFVKNKDSAYWNRRSIAEGHLSLYTLVGDNWSDGKNNAPIKNLLVREINQDCFSAEISLTDFVPHESWQQAGLLLSEDSAFKGKTLRFSIGYNDFFGGYSNPPEVILQIVGAIEDEAQSRPEEIAHIQVFSGKPQSDTLIRSNLSKSALKIEKRENHYKFLFTTGQSEMFAFREAAHGDYNIQPKYIGIFAMQGLATKEKPIPVGVNSFNLVEINCR